MRVLGLDIATKTGYALLDSKSLVDKGLVTIKKLKNQALESCAEDFGFVCDAENMGEHLVALVSKCKPDFIYIEQTNKGRNRTSQKQLEFIHEAVLRRFWDKNWEQLVRYVDTSAWRSSLGVRMTKEDRDHNKKVKAGKIRGKLTPKHLAVRWANERYDLELLLKDNDIADAIAVATYGYIYENTEKPNVTPALVERIFRKS